MKEETFDVAVVGASVAGASLAIRLAGTGIKSILFDKADFPRFKPCGDGLSRAAIRELQEIGINEAQITNSGIPFYEFSVVEKDQEYILPFSTPGCSAGVAIKREALDYLLHSELNKAQLLTKKLGVAVQNIEENESAVLLKTEQETVRAKYLVWAGGTNKKLFNYAKPFIPRYGYTVIFEGQGDAPKRGVTIITKDGYELYLTRIADNLLNASVLGSPSAFKERSTEIWKTELSEAALQYLNFTAQRALHTAGSGPFGTFRNQAGHKRIICIGDAALCLDPISGLGMSHALISSRYAAEALRAICNDGVPSEEAFKKFNLRSDRIAKKLIGFTRLIILTVQGGMQYRPLRFLTNTSMPLAIKDRAFGEGFHPLSAALSVIGRI
jgi:flavin-dependent dehydrogenase